MFAGKLHKRDSPGLPSRANKRSLAIGLAVSAGLHVAIVALLLLSAARQGDVGVLQRPDALQSASQITLLAAPDSAEAPAPAAAPSVMEVPAEAKPQGTMSPAPSAAAPSDRGSVAMERRPAQSGAPVAAAASAQATPAATGAAQSSDMAALGNDYRRRLLAHIADHRETPPAGTPLGTVYVRFLVARAGDVTSIQVTVGSGDSILDRTAVDSIRSANPMPPIPFGFPDQLSVMLPIDFRRIEQVKVFARP